LRNDQFARLDSKVITIHYRIMKLNEASLGVRRLRSLTAAAHEHMVICPFSNNRNLVYDS
jgi:hypothetical protein